jgi:hypothetical protein
MRTAGCASDTQIFVQQDFAVPSLWNAIVDYQVDHNCGWFRTKTNHLRDAIEPFGVSRNALRWRAAIGPLVIKKPPRTNVAYVVAGGSGKSDRRLEQGQRLQAAKSMHRFLSGSDAFLRA